jgi:phosphonate transport system substrate-binding protein
MFGYSVAIVPQFTPAVIEQTWTPVLNTLSAKSSLPLTLKFYKTIPEFEKALAKGQVDFAYMNPYHAVLYKKHYEPIIKDGKKKLFGIVVVKKDSSFSAVKDLNGKSFSFPAPNAFAASLLIRSNLQEVHKINFTTSYVQSHSNVYRSVLTGKCDAGGGVNKTFEAETSDVTSGLKIIYKTPTYNPHPFCANKRLPKNVVQKVQEAFVLLGSEPSMKKDLNEIEVLIPAVTSYKVDYKELEHLKLDRYIQKITE